jgi:hypothetical protein
VNDPNPLHETLRQYVLEGVESRADALRIAQRFTLREMDEALHGDFLDHHAEAASAFLRWWLTQLDPLERVPAHEWVVGLYLSSLVHLDHSYGIAAEVALDSLERSVATTADLLGEFRVLTDGCPCTEVDVAFADRLEALRPAVMDVHRAITQIHAEAIPDRPWEAAGGGSPVHIAPAQAEPAPASAVPSTAQLVAALLRPLVRYVARRRPRR